jgi:hypothetical protein
MLKAPTLLRYATIWSLMTISYALDSAGRILIGLKCLGSSGSGTNRNHIRDLSWSRKAVQVLNICVITERMDFVEQGFWRKFVKKKLFHVWDILYYVFFTTFCTKFPALQIPFWISLDFLSSTVIFHKQLSAADKIYPPWIIFISQDLYLSAADKVYSYGI